MSAARPSSPVTLARLAAVALAVVIWFVPPPEGLTVPAWRLFALFVAARQVWTVPLFVVYYTTTSALHYFYDGLIWKMRRPEVRAPIVAYSLNRSSV